MSKLKKLIFIFVSFISYLPSQSMENYNGNNGEGYGHSKRSREDSNSSEDSAPPKKLKRNHDEKMDQKKSDDSDDLFLGFDKIEEDFDYTDFTKIEQSHYSTLDFLYPPEEYFNMGLTALNEYNLLTMNDAHRAKRIIEKALGHFNDSAKRGYSLAKYKIGLLQFENIPINRNPHLGWALIKEAANEGIVHAQFDIATFLLDNHIINNDPSAEEKINEGIHYLRLAANQHHPEALATMGYVFQKGIGFPKDNDFAIYYYQRAISQGSSTAQEQIKTVGNFDHTQNISYDLMKNFVWAMTANGTHFAKLRSYSRKLCMA